MIESVVTMPANIVRTLRTCQAFATCETTVGKNYGAIGGMIDPPAKIANRLAAFRQKTGLSQVAFAKKLGIEKNTYNPFETGARPLTFETACLIRRHHNVPIDWLFFGDMGKSSNPIVEELGPDPRPKPRPVKQKRRRKKLRSVA